MHHHASGDSSYQVAGQEREGVSVTSRKAPAVHEDVKSLEYIGSMGPVVVGVIGISLLDPPEEPERKMRERRE